MAQAKNTYFIAGLPRSGSTLLAAILRQNPDIHAAMSSPVEHIFSSTVTSMSGQNNFVRFITNAQRERLLRNIFDSYYADVASTWIFDTNRNWPAKLPSLTRLFPETKIICCVRDLLSIMNSFEHLVANNPYMVSRIFGWDAKMTVYGRFEKLMGADGAIGRAINALKEGYYGQHKDRLFFVEYDALAHEPHDTIAAIYKTLGIPHFEHDFKNVSYEEQRFDADLGLSNMHTVRSSVSTLKRTLIVPEDLAENLRGAEFWR